MFLLFARQIKYSNYEKLWKIEENLAKIRGQSAKLSQI
jgi:hypothetical protein